MGSRNNRQRALVSISAHVPVCVPVPVSMPVSVPVSITVFLPAGYSHTSFLVALVFLDWRVCHDLLDWRVCHCYLDGEEFLTTQMIAGTPLRRQCWPVPGSLCPSVCLHVHLDVGFGLLNTCTTAETLSSSSPLGIWMMVRSMT